MSTIMTSADGKRRCDGTCHNAKHPKCGCICNGRYHGAAVLRTKSEERKEMEEIVLKKTLQKVEEKASPESVNQLMMFGGTDGDEAFGLV
jgi:hypothetical protein